MKTIIRICIASVLILFLIIACTVENKPPLTPIVTITPIQSLVLITKTPTSASTATVALPAPTTLPVLTGDNIRQALTQFVQENGGCKLPCILGLSPVHSSRASVQQFSQYFQDHSQSSDDQTNGIDIDGYYNNNFGGAWLVFWKNRVRVDVVISASFLRDAIHYIALSTGVYKHTGEYANESAEILSSHPDYDELLGQFSLPNILRDYGQPDEIWVKPFPENDNLPYTYRTGSAPFDFLLIYSDDGFAVEYMAWVIVTDDGYLMGCPNTAYMKIASWKPDRKVDFAEMASYFSGTHSLSASNYFEFKPIQEVTLLQVEDFYENYKNPDFSECVKTPRSLWP